MYAIIKLVIKQTGDGMDTADIMYAQEEKEQDEIINYIEEAYQKVASINIIDKAICTVVDKMSQEKIDAITEVLNVTQEMNDELRKRNRELADENWSIRCDQKKIEDYEKIKEELRALKESTISIIREGEELKEELKEVKEELKEVKKENIRLEETLSKGNDIMQENHELRKRDELLTALENGGVDNWEGYEISLEEFNNKQE